MDGGKRSNHSQLYFEKKWRWTWVVSAKKLAFLLLQKIRLETNDYLIIKLIMSIGWETPDCPKLICLHTQVNISLSLYSINYALDLTAIWSGSNSIVWCESLVQNKSCLLQNFFRLHFTDNNCKMGGCVIYLNAQQKLLIFQANAKNNKPGTGQKMSRKSFDWMVIFLLKRDLIIVKILNLDIIL